MIGLIGPFSAPWSRLLHTARAMSQENVELVKGLFAAGSDMDKEAFLSVLPELIAQTCDPEIEWHEDPLRADARVYRGHDGVRKSFERWLDQWDEYGSEAERFIDCGDDVLAVAREHGRGARSGATVSGRIFIVVTFRNGKLLRYREFYDEAAALEAVGLSQQDAHADS
jgi:ketosteroid isomerase-like protein